MDLLTLIASSSELDFIYGIDFIINLCFQLVPNSKSDVTVLATNGAQIPPYTHVSYLLLKPKENIMAHEL
jgi:hypothetical protein